MHPSLALAAALLGLAATTGHAAVTHFGGDKSGFLSATGATSIGALPGSGGNNTVVGPVKFTNGPSAVLAFGNFSNEIAGTDLGVSGVENINLDIAGGAYAIGFELHEPSYVGSSSPVNGCNAPCINSPFRIRLLDGSVEVDSFVYDAPNDGSPSAGGPLGFYGVVSTAKFTRVEIRDTSNNIDNEFFGNFLLLTTPPVPEPATGALALGGLAAVSALARRRQRAAGSQIGLRVG